MKILKGAGALSLAAMLAACGNADDGQDKTTEDVTTEEATTEEATTEDVTTEEATTEEVTSEEVTTEESTEASTEETADAKESDALSFVSEDGKVNVKSPEFHEYFFRHNHVNDFAKVKVGMTRAEVEDIYGKSTKDGNDGHQGGADRFGDIAVYFSNDKVAQIMINPSQKISLDEAKELYGEPTKDEDDPTFGKMYIYNTNLNNGYEIRLMFDGDGNITAMHNQKGK